jgi:hypothetical protein
MSDNNIDRKICGFKLVYSSCSDKMGQGTNIIGSLVAIISPFPALMEVVGRVEHVEHVQLIINIIGSYVQGYI